jgi:D-alanine-D-alanine ligase
MSSHILVLYNLPTLDPAHPEAESEREALETAAIVAEELQASGHRLSRLGINHDPMPLLHLIREDRPAAVFNLFEGTAMQGQTEATVAGLLEWAQVPFTGSPSLALTIARDKPRAKLLLQGAGLPTPAFRMADQLPVSAEGLNWPVILKPAREDASIGLDQESVVSSPGQLNERTERLLRSYGPPVLIEEYVAGREFNLTVIEDPSPRVLPIAEIAFATAEPNLWPIVTYDAKWKPESRDFLASPPRCPADVAPHLEEQLRWLALQAFQLLGCRQYARIDFRVDDRGHPFILEVNPNPDLHPDSGLAKTLLVVGISHAQFTGSLIEELLSRDGR